jgi:hypothetical protein
VARIRSCETGLSWGRLAIVTLHSFPGPWPDVSGPPLWRVLAFLGFWVRAAPHDTPRIGAVVDQLARRNRVAGSREIATGAFRQMLPRLLLYHPAGRYLMPTFSSAAWVAMRARRSLGRPGRSGKRQGRCNEKAPADRERTFPPGQFRGRTPPLVRWFRSDRREVVIFARTRANSIDANQLVKGCNNRAGLPASRNE